MNAPELTRKQILALEAHFGPRLRQNEPMSRFSVMGVGGPADYLAPAADSAQLESDVRFLWEQEIPFLLLGGGSNILISDAGIRGVVLLNQAKEIRYFDQEGEDPRLWAESGARFGNLARRAAVKGWSGLEWAAGIPGTVGGAVVNNAGAFGSNVAANLELADILQPGEKQIQRSQWPVDQFQYDYRYSVIKSGEEPAVVLSATFKLERSTPAEVKSRISEISRTRQASQPQGSSLGSMFKNPSGTYAGKLIDEAGLKGTRVGDVEISPTHGNFFINLGQGRAADIAALIALVRDEVNSRFGIELELEIQFVGDWSQASQ